MGSLTLTISWPFPYSAAASGAILTPSLAYASSGWPARMPASCSIQTSWPALTRSPAAAGTSATRPSAVLVSLGTPIRTLVLPAAGAARNLRRALPGTDAVSRQPRAARLVLGGCRLQAIRPERSSFCRREYTCEYPEALPPVDPWFRPRGLDRRRLCRPRQPQAGGGHRA